MSSWIGHGTAAVTILASDKRTKRDLSNLLWALWLTVVAIAPDVDYLVPALRVGADQARITHSIAGALTLPVFTILSGLLLGWRGHLLRTRALQVVGAGLSHLVLDLLVGVHPMPLLFPLTLATFNLPFGILPSAPLMLLDNPLLYRNLLIEIGVLAPLAFATILVVRRPSFARRYAAALVALSAISVIFMTWAFTLSR